MPPTPSRPTPVRSAAAVNEAIRDLWRESGGTLTAEQRAEYGRLLEEWEQAVRGEITEAA